MILHSVCDQTHTKHTETYSVYTLVSTHGSNKYTIVCLFYVRTHNKEGHMLESGVGDSYHEEDSVLQLLSSAQDSCSIPDTHASPSDITNTRHVSTLSALNDTPAVLTSGFAEAEAAATLSGVVTDASVTGHSLGPDNATNMHNRTHVLASGQVDRVVSGSITDGLHLSREARIAFQKVGTIAVLYLTCLANENRLRTGKKRATLSVQDITEALTSAGMSHLIASMHTRSKRARE